MTSDREQELRDLARRVLPAGGFGNVMFDTIIAEGRAGRVWDVFGREYVDFLLGSGPMLLGHAHPEVTEVVLQKVTKGTTFFANNEDGIRLAAEIVDAVPCAEQVRFLSSGSEADMYAMRLARAHTRRDKIMKFEGGYHGMSDYGLMSLAPKRPGNSHRPIPDSAGIPASSLDEVLVAPFNDLEAAENLVRQHEGELAAVIVEPFQRLIPPQPGFLEGLRRITRQYGILLIFDEVVTGFRFAYGGAQEYYGIVPDICTLGKVIGGGFALAAVASSGEIMAHFDRTKVGDDGFLMQVGTLSGNPIAAAAGLKTLEILRRPGTYEHLFAMGRKLMTGYSNVLAGSGIEARVVGDAPMFDVLFTGQDVRDYRSSMSNAELQRRYGTLMRERGVLKSDNKHYVSHAHTDEDVGLAVQAFADSMRELERSR